MQDARRKAHPVSCIPYLVSIQILKSRSFQLKSDNLKSGLDNSRGIFQQLENQTVIIDEIFIYF